MKVKDKIIKQVAARLKQKRPRGNCPGEESLAAFAEGALAPEKQEVILGHIARCSSCFETVYGLQKILGESDKESEIRVPIRALERAAALDPASRSIMEVVIRFARGVAEVIGMSGDAVSGVVPAAESVRGEGKVVSDTLVTFTKDFPPYAAEVDVEKVRPETGEITIRLVEKEDNSPARGLRVSLFKKDQELESAVVEGGIAVFENVRFGQYHLEITRVGASVGRITLEMKGEGK